jgi:hypothetical protein
MDTWWLNFFWTPRWSQEETSVRTRIWGLGCIFFLVPYIPLVQMLRRVLAMDDHRSAIISFALTLPPALYLGRKGCERMWPELVRTADENAAKRIAG